jgi:hypothetical protein
MDGNGHQKAVPIAVGAISMPAEFMCENAADVTFAVLSAVGLDITVLVVDLTQTVFWYPPAIRELANAYGLATSVGVDFRVVRPANPDADRRWTSQGLDQLLKCYPSLAAATDGRQPEAVWEVVVESSWTLPPPS